MTGAALTEAQEFMKIYKTPTVEIPNVPMVRADQNDAIYKTKDGKWKAVVARAAPPQGAAHSGGDDLGRVSRCSPAS